MNLGQAVALDCIASARPFPRLQCAAPSVPLVRVHHRKEVPYTPAEEKRFVDRTPRRHTGKIALAIIKVLEGRGESSAFEIAEAAGVPQLMISKALERLMLTGDVERRGPRGASLYRLPEVR